MTRRRTAFPICPKKLRAYLGKTGMGLLLLEIEDALAEKAQECRESGDAEGEFKFQRGAELVGRCDRALVKIGL